MSTMSLAEARIKLNMPFASEVEVRSAALKNNIQIIDLNLGGIKNTANLNDLNNNVGGSLFGGTMANSSAQQTLNTPIFGGSAMSGFTNTPSLSQPSLSTPAFADTSSVFGNSGFQKMNPLNFNFNNFISSSVAIGNDNFEKMNEAKLKILDGHELVDQSRVVSTEFGENGQIIQTLDNGEKVTIKINPENLHNNGKDGKYSKIEYIDGQVVYYDLSGNKIEEKTRLARYGERGYVKSGNSIEEDLQAKVGGRYDKLVGVQGEIEDLKAKMSELEPDDPQRAEIQKQIEKLSKKEDDLTKKVMADYVKQIIKECNGDEAKLKAKIEELINNSDVSSKTSIQFYALVSQVHEARKNGLSQEALTDVLESIIDDTNPDAAVEKIGALSSEVAKGKGRKGAQMATSFGQAANRSGHGNAASNAMIRNAHNVEDAEVAEAIGVSAIVISDDPAEASQSLEHALNNPPEGVVISDEVKVGWSGGFDKAGVQTGNTDVMQSGQNVITSIKDAELQVKANAHSSEIYETASDDVKEKHSGVVGSNLHKYHKDAQLRVDENERAHDTNDAYNTSASNYLYLTSAENQKELIQRTIDSENEDAINNIASHAYDYDISNREDIIRMIKEQGTEKTLEILENARKEYEAQDADNKAATEFLKEANAQKDQAAQQSQQAKSNQQTQQTQSTQQTQTRVARPTVQQNVSTEPQSLASKLANSRGYIGLTPVQTYVMSEEFKSADMHTKQDYINKLNVSDRKQAVAALVETSTPAQLTAYMYSGLKKNILSYLVKNPGGKNTETLKYLSGFLSGPDKQFIKELEEERNKLLGLKHPENNLDFTQNKRNPFNIEA